MTTIPDILRLESASIRTSAELKAALVERLDAPGPVRIDGAAMERVDTPTLQLLAAFVRELRAGSHSVEWVARSEALDRAAQALGLSAVLGLTSQGN